MSTETRSLSSDFGGNWNQGQLHQEILSEASISTNLIGINYEEGADDINILFDSNLSAAEITALNNLISAHTPTISLDESKYVDVSDNLVSTSTSFLTQSTLITNSIEESIYKISWYYEYSFAEGDFEAQILIDDSTKIHHLYWGPYDNSLISDYNYTQSGFKKLALSSGVHTIKLQFRMLNGGEGSIQNVNIDVEESRDSKLY